MKNVIYTLTCCVCHYSLFHFLSFLSVLFRHVLCLTSSWLPGDRYPGPFFLIRLRPSIAQRIYKRTTAALLIFFFHPLLSSAIFFLSIRPSIFHFFYLVVVVARGACADCFARFVLHREFIIAIIISIKSVMKVWSRGMMCTNSSERYGLPWAWLPLPMRQTMIKWTQQGLNALSIHHETSITHSVFGSFHIIFFCCWLVRPSVPCHVPWKWCSKPTAFVRFCRASCDDYDDDDDEVHSVEQTYAMRWAEGAWVAVNRLSISCNLILMKCSQRSLINALSRHSIHKSECTLPSNN